MKDNFKYLREVSKETGISYKKLYKIANKLDEGAVGNRKELGLSEGVHLITTKNGNKVVDRGYHKTFVDNIVKTASLA